MTQVIIGIDIGLTGAVCSIDWNGTPRIEDLPTVANADGSRTVKKRLCPVALRNLLFRLCPAVEAAHVVFEDIHAGIGRGSAARASLMHSRGVIEAVVECAGMSWTAVTPTVWKRHYGLIKASKDASRQTALRLYPTAAPMLKRAKDHNRAEAVLLAHYGRKEIA